MTHFKEKIFYKYQKRQHQINEINNSTERVSSSEPPGHFTGQEPYTETAGAHKNPSLIPCPEPNESIPLMSYVFGYFFLPSNMPSKH